MSPPMLTDWQLLAALILGTVALCLSTYGLARRFLDGRGDEHTPGLAKTVVDRIATLLSLILALVFAQEFLNYNETRAAIDREGTLLSNTYFDLKRYDPVTTLPMQQDLVAYATSVIVNEWPILANEHRLDEATWQMRENVYLGALDLKPQNERQKDLRERVVRSMMQLGDERDKRGYAAGRSVGPAFWIVSFAGILLVSVLFFAIPPVPINIVVITVFAIYTGLVLSLIGAYADPFQRPGYLGPEPIQAFLHQVERGIR